MHVLITGGAGFIGSNLAAYHLSKGDQVYVIDDLSTGVMSNIEPFFENNNFQYEIADILTWPGLNEAVFWADRIYHMAAVIGVFRVLKSPTAVLATNITGCERLLRAVNLNKWRPKVLIASSSCVYGITSKTPCSEDDFLSLKSAVHSLWSYSISKLAEEFFSLAYAREKNAKITIARLFNTIGPGQRGQYGMVVPRLVQQAVKGDAMTIFGDGSQTRTFCDVRDTVVMLDSLLNNDKAVNEIVNVGGEVEISINDLAALIKQVTQSKSPIKHLSYQQAYGENMDETMRRSPCLKKLHSLISYKNQWSLEDTIRDLVNRQGSAAHDV